MAKGPDNPSNAAAASVTDLVAEARRLLDTHPDLFRHQAGGAAFLRTRQRAILADEMGLGKTRTAIVAAREHLRPHGGKGNVLVICPASLKLNWRREILAVDPSARIQVLNSEPLDTKARWVIVNYDRLARYAADLAAWKKSVVIVDEAHYIKNRNAARSKTTLTLLGAGSGKGAAPAPRDLAVYLLTGTPMMNRPRDLFNLMRAVGHPLSRNYVHFAQQYCAGFYNDFGLVDDGASNVEELARRLNSVMLRRTKAEAMDLPDKVRTWLPLELPTKRVGSLEQRALDYLRKNPSRSGPTWGTYLAKLNEARHALAVLKATATADFVGDCVEAGQKVVVFSSYHGAIDVLKERFGDTAVSLTGEHTMKQRDAAVQRFQNDDAVRVFIGNLHAAGVGLTLTAGTHVVFNDLDWVPANHWQAEDRIHRIGQTQTAFVTYLYSQGTLDEFVAHLLEQKAKVIGILDDGTTAQASMLEALVDLATGVKTPDDVWVDEQSADHDGPTMGLSDEWLQVLAELGLTSQANDDSKVFEYPSKRDKSVVYRVDVTEGAAVCECPGFVHGGSCWHVKDALKRS